MNPASEKTAETCAKQHIGRDTRRDRALSDTLPKEFGPAQTCRRSACLLPYRRSRWKNS